MAVSTSLLQRDTRRHLVCGALLLLAALLGAMLEFRIWVGLDDRHPLLAELPLAAPSRPDELPPPRQLRRAVLIIADGLNAEQSLTLAPLQQLAARGIRAEAEAAGPTFSRASYVTWLVGLDPVDSGVRTNRYRGPLPLDSLPAKARASGLTCLGYEDGPEPLLHDLFRSHWSIRLSGPESWPRLLQELRRSDLAILALLATDRAGHLYGAASSQYRQAAEETARRIAEVNATLDFEQDLLVVVNDHGHLAAGGHGGVEPQVRKLFLLAAGAGLTSGGVVGRLEQKDLASMLAHLLGLLPPTHSRGSVPSWALHPTRDPRSVEIAATTQYRSRLRVERFLADKLRVAAAPGAAQSSGWEWLQVLQERVDHAQLARLGELRIQRGIGVGALLLPCVLVLVLGGRPRSARGAACGVLLAVLAPVAIMTTLWLLHIRLSFSAGGSRWLWLACLLGAGASGGLLHAAGAYILRKRCGQAPALGSLLTGAWLFTALALATWVLIPVAPGSALPDSRLLASALMSGVCWIGYLAAVGLSLTLAGLPRVDQHPAIAP